MIVSLEICRPRFGAVHCWSRSYSYTSLVLSFRSCHYFALSSFTYSYPFIIFMQTFSKVACYATYPLSLCSTSRSSFFHLSLCFWHITHLFSWGAPCPLMTSILNFVYSLISNYFFRFILHRFSSLKIRLNFLISANFNLFLFLHWPGFATINHCLPSNRSFVLFLFFYPNSLDS